MDINKMNLIIDELDYAAASYLERGLFDEADKIEELQLYLESIKNKKLA